jgi:integrase
MSHNTFNQKVSPTSRAKARISVNDECLRISLPAYLYEGRRKFFALGLSNTPENRPRAEAKRLEIQQDIDYGEFDLTLEKYKPGFKNKVNISDNQEADRVNSEPEGITLQEMLDNFKERYFRTRPINRKSKKTFERLQDVTTRAFSFKKSLDFKLGKEDINAAIELKEAGTYLRYEVVECLRVFFRCFEEFNYEFEEGIAAGYKPEPRDIPTDEEIIEAWQIIKAEGNYNNRNFDGNAESWGWIFAVIATYGLRPHEVLAIDYEKSFKPPNFILYIDENITEGTKTGSRFVYPLPLEWVNLFDIANLFR